MKITFRFDSQDFEKHADIIGMLTEIAQKLREDKGEQAQQTQAQQQQIQQQLDYIMNYAREKAQKIPDGRQKVIYLMGKYGASGMSQIAPTNYTDFLKDLEGLQ